MKVKEFLKDATLAILIFLILLLVSGCATQGIRTEVQKVEVPIAVQCKTDLPQKPNYSFDNLKPEDDLFTKTKALLSDIELYKAYTLELEAALRSCK